MEPVHNENGRTIGKKHYRVNFTMVIQVVDRDLRCKFEPNDFLIIRKDSFLTICLMLIGYAIYNQELKKKCRINIASGFRPGVK